MKNKTAADVLTEWGEMSKDNQNKCEDTTIMTKGEFTQAMNDLNVKCEMNLQENVTHFKVETIEL